MRGKKKEARAEVIEDDSLQRAFELAHFILNDKVSAIDVVACALQKLTLQCRRERRRVYWRYKHPSQPIRRITRKDGDALQWLILYESEAYERRQEQCGTQSSRDMVVRYIKHIVRLATPMSSFYVSVGLSRLLFSYSTSEVQAAYELVTNRFLSPDQYRRAKSVLTNQLRVRFQGLLELIKGPHGEVRFRPLENQGRWMSLADKCLSMFTPWSTNGLCSRITLNVGADDRLRSSGPAIGESEAEPDAAEMNRCHIFIEPSCRRRLVEALGLPAPESKLALPRFMMRDNTDDNDRDGSGLPAAGLSAGEKKRIIESLAAADEQRQRMAPDSVKIIIDGVECSSLVLSQHGHVALELEAGQRLIEMRGRDDDGEMLLGTHLISYVNGTFASAKGFLMLTNGRLDLVIAPATSTLKTPRATLTLRFKPRFHLAWRTEGLTWR